MWVWFTVCSNSVIVKKVNPLLHEIVVQILYFAKVKFIMIVVVVKSFFDLKFVTCYFVSSECALTKIDQKSLQNCFANTIIFSCNTAK